MKINFDKNERNNLSIDNLKLLYIIQKHNIDFIMINKQFPNSLKILTDVLNNNKNDIELNDYITILPGFQTNMDLAKEQLDFRLENLFNKVPLHLKIA